MQDGIIILPTEPAEPAEGATEAAAAVQSLTETAGRVSTQIRGAALAGIAGRLDGLARRAQAAADAAEPDPAELDSIEAEYKELVRLCPELLPELQPLPALDGLPMPLDRITRQIFAQRGEPGKYRVKQNRSTQAPIIALLEIGATPDTVQRLERLSAYDKRLLLTVGGLSENGLQQFSFAQLFDAMGGQSRPGTKQLEQMQRAIARLCSCFVRLEFTEASGTPNEKALKLGFPLLSMKYAAARYHGQEVTAIHLLERPTWLHIAELRKQITAVPFTVFSDGLPLTENSIAVSDYLLTEIAHMKRQKDFSRHMRLDSIAAGAGVDIAHREKRRRLADKIEKKLMHFSAVGHIRGFERYAGGFKISP